MCVYVFMCRHLEARLIPDVLLKGSLCLRQGLPLILEVTDSASPRICPSLPLQHWNYKPEKPHLLDVGAWQTFHPLNHIQHLFGVFDHKFKKVFQVSPVSCHPLSVFLSVGIGLGNLEIWSSLVCVPISSIVTGSPWRSQQCRNLQWDFAVLCYQYAILIC